MKNLTLSQSIEGYFIFAQSRLSENTLQDYANTFRKFQDFLGSDIELNRIETNQIEAFLNSFHHLKKKTLLNYHTGLSALWSWAYDRKLVAEKVPQSVKPPRPDEVAVIPYTETDIKAMLAYAGKTLPYHRLGQREASNTIPEGTRSKTTLLLLLDTGIRASEFCNLKMKDIDLRNQNIVVLGKGRKERQIPISARTSQSIWTYFSERKNSSVNAWAFCTESGLQIRRDNLLKIIYRLGARAGVQDPTIHRFRHTFAINFLRNGGDIYTLQRILGHSTLDMVKRYLAIAQVDIQAAHRRASPVTNWGL